MNRREFVTAAGGAVLGAFTLGVASAEPDYTAKPSHVTLEFDQSALEDYQPLLVTEQNFRSRFKGMYGYVARSDEYAYDVHCYITQLTHQDGLPGIGADSHLGDHEPLYVYVNGDGEPELFVYSGYHWFASEIRAGDANLTQDRRSDESHGNFRVIEPWHNYSHSDDIEGTFFDLEDWPAVRDQWVDNGFYSSAAPEAFEDPITMLRRNGWWAEGTLDHRVAQIWAGLGRRVGFFGGDRADDIR